MQTDIGIAEEHDDLDWRVKEAIRREIGIPHQWLSSSMKQALERGYYLDCKLIDDPRGSNLLDQLQHDPDEDEHDKDSEEIASHRNHIMEVKPPEPEKSFRSRLKEERKKQSSVDHIMAF